MKRTLENSDKISAAIRGIPEISEMTRLLIAYAVADVLSDTYADFDILAFLRECSPIGVDFSKGIADPPPQLEAMIASLAGA